MLDRSDNPAVAAYQDWIEAPEYMGKSENDVAQNTITSLLQVFDWLEKGCATRD